MAPKEKDADEQLSSGEKTDQRTFGGVAEQESDMGDTMTERVSREEVQHTPGPEEPTKPATGASDEMIGNKRIDTATGHVDDDHGLVE